MDVKEKLIKLIKNGVPCPDGRDPFGEYCDKCRYSESADCSNERLADYLISHGVTVQEWISVNDKLPDETGQYLAVKKRIAPDDFGGDRTDIVIIRFFVDDGFRMPVHIPDWINKKINEEVTHWMPLPEPPKGE